MGPMGPQVQRAHQAIDPTDEAPVRKGANEWRTWAETLDVVAKALETAADQGISIGGRSGPALVAALRTSAEGVRQKAGELRKGHGALEDSAGNLNQARTRLEALNQQAPLNGPRPEPVRLGNNASEQDVQRQQNRQSEIDNWDQTYQAREILAKQIADEFDEENQRTGDVMKSLYWEPERTPGGGGEGPTAPSGGSGPRPTGQSTYGPGGGGGGDNGPDYVVDVDEDPTPTPDPDPDPDPTDPTDPTGPVDPVDPTDPVDPVDPVDPIDPVDPTTPGTPTSTPPGPGPIGMGPGLIGAGVFAAGAGGVPALVNRLRTALGMPTPVSGAAPIGSTSRSGSAGALGRGAAVPGQPVRATTGTRGALAPGSAVGRSGGRGTGAGGRGGRGMAAGVPTGRRGARKDEDQTHTKPSAFDDGEDWLDDEGAAPGVLG